MCYFRLFDENDAPCGWELHPETEAEAALARAQVGTDPQCCITPVHTCWLRAPFANCEVFPLRSRPRIRKTQSFFS